MIRMQKKIYKIHPMFQLMNSRKTAPKGKRWQSESGRMGGGRGNDSLKKSDFQRA